jgi:hypothetical protein
MTPHQVSHVNQVILPAIDLCDKCGAICKCTANTWLKKLGYSCKDVEKGLYHDDHEWLDVIKARTVFLEKIAGYERYIDCNVNTSLIY